jgi:hypothetical protein
MRYGVVLIVVGALAIATASAHAGGYDVQACNASIAGGANNSFFPVADPGMTAYTYCPAGEGMVARNVWDNGYTGALQGASMIFDAPPGTYVRSIDFAAGWKRNDCNYGYGIVASDASSGEALVWGWGAGTNCDAPEIPDNTSFYPGRFSVPINNSRVRIETRCGWVAFCSRNGVTSIRLKDVTVHVQDDTPPGLSNGRGALWTSSGWLAGSHGVGFDANDGAGIREAAVTVDGRDVAHQTYGCDYALRAPCNGASLDQSFATSAFGSDGPHALQISAVDAGGNATSVGRTIYIDNTAPDAPQNVMLAGADGWRSANSFDLSWTNPSQKGTAPIAGAVYDLCPVPSGPCTRRSTDGANLTGIQGLRLPGPGDYRLTLWLRDAAGNNDRRLAAPALDLRFDNTSPDVAIESETPDDPTRVAALVTDSGSGLGSGQIEIRARTAATWRPLPTAVDGSELVAHIDDEHMRDGVYLLRATAVDQAGNARSTETLADGQTAMLTLPLRLKTRLRAGVVRRRHGRVRLARSASVRYGQVVRVRGRLTTPEGNPLQDVEVSVYNRVRGAPAPPRLVATVKTGRSGRFSFRVRKGPSRTITLRYGGTPEIRSATRIIALNVQAATTLTVDRHRVVNGESVRFRGRLWTRPLPAAGKLIAMQVWVRGKWRTFANTRANRRGRWQYEYRFDGTRGLQIYRFRAQVPRETGYPYSTGRSRTVKVAVRGV